MREVTLRIRHQGEPESEVSRAHPDVTLRSVSSLTGSAAERKRIIELTGPAAEIEAFLDEFGATEPVLAVEPLSPLTNDRVFAGVTFDSYKWDSIAQRLTDLGVHYRMGTTIKNGWEHWTLYLDDTDSLSEIVDSIEAAGNTAELLRDVSLEEVEGREHLALSRMLDDLTDRQREVLAIAIGLGYYEPGADVSIKNIGEEVGIAPTTAWEHLVRAEGKVMGEVGEHITSHGM